MACIVGLCSSAMAAKTATLEVVGGDGKVLVNGKEYVAGTPINSGAKIQITGSLTIKLGGVAIKTDGATFQLSGSTVKVLAGTAQVTNAHGATQTVARGDKVAVETHQSKPAPDSIPADSPSETTIGKPNPENTLQETQQRVVSPSTP